MNGKGDKQRPRQVSYEEYAANYDRIFGSKGPRPLAPTYPANDASKRVEGQSAVSILDGVTVTPEQAERVFEVMKDDTHCPHVFVGDGVPYGGKVCIRCGIDRD